MRGGAFKVLRKVPLSQIQRHFDWTNPTGACDDPGIPRPLNATKATEFKVCKKCLQSFLGMRLEKCSHSLEASLGTGTTEESGKPGTDQSADKIHKELKIPYTMAVDNNIATKT
jgi:hypothetical protein